MLSETAYAKINWSLSITGRRPDGYHLMDMLMQRISLCDTLTVEDADEISLETDDPAIPTGPENLICKAARQLQPFLPQPRGAHFKLKKSIPSQAGLGGGSADCAAALKLLLKLWDMDIPKEQLYSVALKLGADVPFCLGGSFARVRGIGEEISPLPNAREYDLLVLKPDGGVPTQAAFRLFDDFFHQKCNLSLDIAANALSNGDWKIVRQNTANDLLEAALTFVPSIGDCIRYLYDNGALYAAMSGSGSAVFGVFPTQDAAERASRGTSVRSFICRTMTD